MGEQVPNPFLKYLDVNADISEQIADPFAQFTSEGSLGVESPSGVALPSGEGHPLTQELGAKAAAEQPQVGDLSRLKAFGSGAARGGLDTALFAAGATAGWRGTPFLPPPARGLAAGVGGMAVQLTASPPLQSFLGKIGVPGYEDLPPYRTPAYIAGETFTQSLGMAGFTTTAIKRSAGLLQDPGRVGSWINSWLKRVRATKSSTIAVVETHGAAAAATAGSISEEYFPGEAVPRLIGETIGGAINPSLLMVNALRSTWNRTRNVVRTFIPKRFGGGYGGEDLTDDTKRYLKDIFDKVGYAEEDIDALVTSIKEMKDIAPSIISRDTGDPVLSALENSLIDHSGQYGLEVQQKVKDSIETINTLVKALTMTGDSNALVVAAELKQQHIRTLIEVHMETAITKAKLASLNLIQDTGTLNPNKVSKEVSKILETAVKTSGKIEKEVWAPVRRTDPISQENVRALIDKVKEVNRSLTIPPEKQEALSSLWRKFLQRAKRVAKPDDSEIVSIEDVTKRLEDLVSDPDAGRPLTTGDLMWMRSELGDLASEAEKSPYLAKIYGEYSRQLLDILDNHFQLSKDEAYTVARAYTKEYHDYFSRTFAGRARSEGEFGMNIPPEVLMRRAIAGGAEASDVRLQELEDATQYLVQVFKKDELAEAISRAKVDYDPEEAAKLMLLAQEKMMRVVLSEPKFRDTLTGRLKPRALSDFMKRREVLFDRMPGLKEHMEQAIKSELALTELEKNIPKYGTPSQIPEAMGVDPHTAKLASMLEGVDRPALVVTNILNSPSPVKGVKSLMGIAKGQKGGVESLRLAIMESLGDTVEAKIGRLREPIAEGQPTLIEVLKQEGVIDDTIYTQMEKIFKVFDNQMAAEATHQRLPLPGRETTAGTLLHGFLARLMGQRALEISQVAPKGAGAISTYGMAARMSEFMMDKIPTEQQIKLLQRVMVNDGGIAELFLEDVSKLPEKETFMWLGRVHGYLLQAGILPVEEEPE